MRLTDKLLARKRSIIETIIDAVSAAPGACLRENADQLKNISQIEHSRHRSPVNFMVRNALPLSSLNSIQAGSAVNVLCGLIAYSHRPKKRFSALGGFPDLKRLNQEAITPIGVGFASLGLTRTQVNISFCITKIHFVVIFR